MADKKKFDGKLLLSPAGRLSFCSLFEARETDLGDKFETNLIVPPGPKGVDSPELQAIRDELQRAMEHEFGSDPKKWPRNARTPDDVIRDAEDNAKFKGYEPGWVYFSARCNADNPPQVVDAVRQPVTDEKQAYPGRWARLAVRAYPYDNKSKGVSLALVHVQLLKHDERLAGPPAAKDIFDDMAEEMDTDDI
jgi:Protein of unknown function (DUF2815)